MNDSLDHNSVSIVEDFGPEISGPNGLARFWELLLGSLLLVGVLTWAGWQWWQQETVSNAYKSAQVAVSSRHWDQALDLFVQASGYHDADARAVEIRKTVARRDEAYRAARADALTGEWAASLEAVQTVEGIEPTYKDMSELKGEALRNVFTDSSLGAIASRSSKGQPAGLYYRSADAWQRLDGSDARSRLITDSSSNKQARYVLYDTPGGGASMPAASPQVTRSSERVTSTGADLAGRKLAVSAPWVAKYNTKLLALDPAEYSFFVPGRNGIYAFAAQQGRSSLFPTWSSPYVGYSATYQALDASTASPIVMPGPDWIIVDIDEASGSLLLASSKIAQDRGLETSLYIADSNGANSKLIYSYTGGLHSAQFSPDGASVLATTYQPLPDGRSEEVSIILITPRSATPAQLLARKTTTDTNREFFKALGAAFLRKGPDKVVVLVGDIGLHTSTFTLVDPRTPGEPLSTVAVNGAPYRMFRADAPYAEGSIVLVWQTTPSNISASGSDVVFALEIPLFGAAKSFAFMDPAHRVLTGAWIRDNKLIYSSYSLDADGKQPRLYSVSSLPLVDLTSAGAQGKAIHSAAVPVTAPFSLPEAPNWYLGSRLLSYISGSTLRIETYEASIDLPVEEGSTRLYFPQTATWINLK